MDYANAPAVQPPRNSKILASARLETLENPERPARGGRYNFNRPLNLDAPTFIPANQGNVSPIGAVISKRTRPRQLRNGGIGCYADN